MNNDFNDIEIIQNRPSAIKERLNLVASHMYKQYKEHKEATLNTTKMFYRVLRCMEEVTESLKENFTARDVPESQIFCQTDADKSVGILNILWHSISFTTRGNTKPQALYRQDNTPLFTGRILALSGDFLDASLDIQDQEYPGILSCEIASLYVPADTLTPAILKIKHLGNQEFYLNQVDAPKQFLLKVIEIICGGGIYHEDGFNYEEEI
ncbi:MAG: hypothetical protein A2255_10005 [Candidatus Melainabacteria bacterium RIFOXYA2_FULL_32_9]|nr:MAG: hypothetical protein A2255_10005 [Candidatus Melainabacteria bacterium RIFOXYA2_FULL_32_9]